MKYLLYKSSRHYKRSPTSPTVYQKEKKDTVLGRLLAGLQNLLPSLEDIDKEEDFMKKDKRSWPQNRPKM